MGMVILCAGIYFTTCILCGATFAVNDTKFWKIWSVGNVLLSFFNFMWALDRL